MPSSMTKSVKSAFVLVFFSSNTTWIRWRQTPTSRGEPDLTKNRINTKPHAISNRNCQAIQLPIDPLLLNFSVIIVTGFSSYMARLMALMNIISNYDEILTYIPSFEYRM